MLEFEYSSGTPLNLVVSALFQWIREGDLIIDPDFQRGSVWTTEQQEAWIKSILAKMPLPAIFYNSPQDMWEGEWKGKMVVIDGRQRLEAMMAFEEDRLLVDGEKFSDQSQIFHRKWSNVALPVIQTSFDTKQECVELYVRLLTTGTSHTQEEIDKAKALLDAKEETCTWCGGPVRYEDIQQICVNDCAQKRYDDAHPDED